MKQVLLYIIIILNKQLIIIVMLLILGTINESSIIEVQSNQKLNHDTIHRVLNTVRDELGSTTDYIQGNETIYFYVYGKLVIGCIIVEKINITTNRVQLNSNQSSADVMIKNDNTKHLNNLENIKSYDDILNQNQKNRPILGIRQIWVDNKFRKQGVANKLVDCARKNFSYGLIIPRYSIAFSQPTRDGQAFGLSYTKNECGSIWTYA